MAESSQESSVATDESLITKSSVVTDELQVADNKIDIHHSICIPNAVEFPVEDFFSVPFTHHTRLMAMCKDLDEKVTEQTEKVSEQAEDKAEGVQVFYKDESIWATQKAMAMLFDCSTDNISLHLKNIFESGELIRESVTDIDAEWVSGVYYIDSKGNKIYPYNGYRNPTPNPLSGVFPWILEPQRLGL